MRPVCLWVGQDDVRTQELRFANSDVEKKNK